MIHFTYTKLSGEGFKRKDDRTRVVLIRLQLHWVYCSNTHTWYISCFCKRGYWTFWNRHLLHMDLLYEAEYAVMKMKKEFLYTALFLQLSVTTCYNQSNLWYSYRLIIKISSIDRNKQYPGTSSPKPGYWSFQNNTVPISRILYTVN